MDFSPRFSVIIPTYNRASFLPETVKSAVNQIYKPIEIIVVDDGSKDDTETVVSKMDCSFLKYVKTANQERGAARNLGSSMAHGDYIYFLDSDDILYSNHFDEARKFINMNDELPWFFQHYEFLSKERKTIPIKYNTEQPLQDLVCRGNFMSCHGVFLRKDIAARHPFPEDRAMAGSEDYALWIQLGARYPLKINPVVTSALLQHDERSVFNFKPEALVLRKEKMLSYILNDKEVIHAFRQWLPKLQANTFSYIALHTALTGHSRISFKFLLKAAKTSPSFLSSKRFLATIKHLIQKIL